MLFSKSYCVFFCIRVLKEEQDLTTTAGIAEHTNKTTVQM